METATMAGIGHNNPPTPFETIAAEIDGLMIEAENWLDGAGVNSDSEHDAVTALDKMLLDAGKRLETERKVEVAPFDNAKAAIQARYKPVSGKVEMAREACKKALQPYRLRKEAEKAAAAAAARKEAEEKAAAARAAFAASQASDLSARVDAERLAAEAKNAERAAIKADKAAATGNALRTVTRAEVRDATAFAKWVWTNKRADLDEFLNDLAARLVRSKIYPPGVEVVTEKVPT